MPVNPYDDCKVSLRRPHGNGDLNIVWASYTRRKANVTEALMVKKQDPESFTRFQTRERCALEIAAYVFKIRYVCNIPYGVGAGPFLA